MRGNLRSVCWITLAILVLAPGGRMELAADEPLPVAWPPDLPGAREGTVQLSGAELLRVPDGLDAAQLRSSDPPFQIADQPPTVRFAYHRELGAGAAERRLWSSWGDICVARDGRVYVGIGDHGNDAGGDARCFLYRWDPAARTLKQIVDMSQVVPPRDGQPAWSKVHAKIDEGPDGKIYFSCTLNAGNRAGQAQYQWNETLPGGQLYRYDPETNRVEVFASLPAKRCTATSLLDSRRNIWWCNLEAGDGDALYGLSLADARPVFQGRDGSVGFNRNFALAADGSLYFNGAEGQLMRLDPDTRMISPTGIAFPDSPGMRASTRPSRRGEIFGVTHRTGQLFRFRPQENQLDLLGSTWDSGQYTTVLVLSPDERYLYYLPGSHGQAFRYGTPVVQYEIATGRRTILAFLAPTLEREIGYVPAGTYGVKLSPDGATLYVNFNGHAADRLRPPSMRPNGFGLCGFAAIEIPAAIRGQQTQNP